MSNEKGDFIYVKIKRPEGYEDVAPEIVLEDLLQNPKANWDIEIIAALDQPATEMGEG